MRVKHAKFTTLFEYTTAEVFFWNGQQVTLNLKNDEIYSLTLPDLPDCLEYERLAKEFVFAELTKGMNNDS